MTSHTPVLYAHVCDALGAHWGHDLLVVARRLALDAPGSTVDAPPEHYRWNQQLGYHERLEQPAEALGMPVAYCDGDYIDYEDERASDEYATEEAHLDRLDIMGNGPGLVGVDIEAAPQPPAGQDGGTIITAIAGGAPMTHAQAEYVVAYQLYCERQDSDYWLAQAESRGQRAAARRAQAFIAGALSGEGCL